MPCATSVPVRRYGCLNRRDRTVWLRQLCGLTCGNCGRDRGPSEILGQVLLDADEGHYEGMDWTVGRVRVRGAGRASLLADHGSAISVESRWSFCLQTGVWRRQDALKNISASPAIIPSLFVTLCLQPRPLSHVLPGSRCGGMRTGASGRISAISNWCCNRLADAVCDAVSRPISAWSKRIKPAAWCFHIVPLGNWVIHVRPPSIPGGSVVPLSPFWKDGACRTRICGCPCRLGATVVLPRYSDPGNAGWRAAAGGVPGCIRI